MTEAISDESSAVLALLPQALGVTALVLLVFVSVGVVYLSSVEWRDRRRRKAAESRRRP
ncbi:MAG: hypothetical protein VKL23_06770 [Cyanobacteriota bacterium]|nr:hypothetical protein [Cyanobacteriota bacterium]